MEIIYIVTKLGFEVFGNYAKTETTPLGAFKDFDRAVPE